MSKCLGMILACDHVKSRHAPTSPQGGRMELACVSYSQDSWAIWVNDDVWSLAWRHTSDVFDAGIMYLHAAGKGSSWAAWFPCYTFEPRQGVVTKLGYKTRKHQRKVRSKTKTMLSSNVDYPHYKGISWYPNFGAAVWNKSKYFARWASADDWDKYSKTLQNSRKSLEKKISLKAWKNPRNLT